MDNGPSGVQCTAKLAKSLTVLLTGVHNAGEVMLGRHV